MSGPRPRLLVVDDGVDYARIVDEQMSEFALVHPGTPEWGLRVPDGPSALDFLERRRADVDLVLLDMHFDMPPDRLLSLGEGLSPRRTRRFQGVAILRAIRQRFPELPVVLLTAVEDLSLVDADGELAAQSMTYFLDGDDLDALRIRIHTALQDAALGSDDADLLWGRDSTMQAVRRRLAVLARGRLPIILEGETGTGKSFLAERFVHVQSGRSGPFVTVDLSTLPRDLVSAHLFGAVRGAYTGAVTDRKGVFELAQRGTLFIDEIQNVPLDVQRQLLLVLQDNRVRPLGGAKEISVDVKVVVASNRPLAESVRSGQFRPDLYMRLSPATRVRLPPLRERPRDLPVLARHFVDKALRDPGNAELRDRVARAVGLSPETPVTLEIGRGSKRTASRGLVLALPQPAWDHLESHQWAGNIRELEMVLCNVVTFTLVDAADALAAGLALHSSRLQVDPGLVGELLAGSIAPLASSDSGADPSRPRDVRAFDVHIEPGETLNAVSSAVERQYFLALFERTDGDFGRMAEVLLGDEGKARAIRLRFNQLGLKVRELRRR